MTIDGTKSWLFSLLDLGDLDGDGLSDTLVGANRYEAAGTAEAVVAFGSDLENAAETQFADYSLRARSERIRAQFGYRTAMIDDMDGDGIPEILFGGSGDNKNTGAVATIPVPQ